MATMGFDAMGVQRRNRRAARIAGVGQHPFRQPDRALHAQDGFGEARRIGRGRDEVGGQHELAAVGWD